MDKGVWRPLPGMEAMRFTADQVLRSVKGSRQ